MVVSFNVEGPIGKLRESQHNFNNEVKTKFTADVTVLNESKMAAMCTLGNIW